MFYSFDGHLVERSDLSIRMTMSRKFVLSFFTKEKPTPILSLRKEMGFLWPHCMRSIIANLYDCFVPITLAKYRNTLTKILSSDPIKYWSLFLRMTGVIFMRFETMKYMSNTAIIFNYTVYLFQIELCPIRESSKNGWFYQWKWTFCRLNYDHFLKILHTFTSLQENDRWFNTRLRCLTMVLFNHNQKMTFCQMKKSFRNCSKNES